MDTNVMMVNNTLHVRFAHSGVAFCDVCLTPEEAADLSQKIIVKLFEYHYPTAPCGSPARTHNND